MILDKKAMYKKRVEKAKLEVKKYGCKIVDINQYLHVKKSEFTTGFILYMMNLLFYIGVAFFFGMVFGANVILNSP